MTNRESDEQIRRNVRKGIYDYEKTVSLKQMLALIPAFIFTGIAVGAGFGDIFILSAITGLLALPFMVIGLYGLTGYITSAFSKESSPGSITDNNSKTEQQFLSPKQPTSINSPSAKEPSEPKTPDKSISSQKPAHKHSGKDPFDLL